MTETKSDWNIAKTARTNRKSVCSTKKNAGTNTKMV